MTKSIFGDIWTASGIFEFPLGHFVLASVLSSEWNSAHMDVTIIAGHQAKHCSHPLSSV